MVLVGEKRLQSSVTDSFSFSLRKVGAINVFAESTLLVFHLNWRQVPDVKLFTKALRIQLC